jgi:DNA-binding transcriptional MocR family regulator
MTAVSAVEELFSVRARNANEARPLPSRSGVISFSAGFPDPAKLPLDGIAEATGRTMSTHGQ